MPPPSHGDPTVAASQPAVERARLAAGLPARAPQATRHLRTRLDVDAPRPGQQIRGLAPWVEVRGRGGLWESTHHDVVVAIDDSASTLLPTGIDLDGDGEVGKQRRPRGMDPDSASSDPDDTVIRAELEAAKVLIRQLDGRTTRVAVVTFAAAGKVLAPLGTPEAALAALEAYEVHVDTSGTSLANGLVMAAQEFFENRDIGVRRQRSVVLLSDGQPTVPSVRQGKRDALEMAEELGDLGVPIHAYALGEEALEDPEFYAGLGERSGGTFVAVRNPADVVGELAAVRFTGLREVTLTSVTLERSGRAVRVFPDGSFDGFVPLVQGENVIEVRATVDGGRTLSEQRTVLFERPEEPQPEDRRRAERLRLDLQERAVEIRLLSEMRRRRSAQTRKLEIEIDTSEPPAR